MYQTDKSENCKIFDSTFHNDLLPYYIKQDEPVGSGYIVYTDNLNGYTSRDIPVPIEIDENLLEYIDGDGSISTMDTEDFDIWLPNFIDKNSYDINYKPIFLKQQIKNPILGIEKALKFPAKFKSWELKNPNDADKESKSKCVSNWYTTSLAGAINPQYSLLFWDKVGSTKYKNISRNGVLLYKDIKDGSHFKNIDQYSFKVENRIYNLPEYCTFVKIKNNYIKIIEISREPLSQQDSPIDKIIDISTLLENNEPIKIDDLYLSIISPSDFKILRINSDGGDQAIHQKSLYISDGECFSYFDGDIEKEKALKNKENSKTYLSPILYNNYREIYHRLTIRSIKKGTSSLTKKRGLALQKLCYFLSTHPQIDRTTVDILNTKEIYNKVQEYISKDITRREDELIELSKIIKFISSKFKKLNTSFYKQSINQNYIYSRKDLIQKILNKYSSQILIEEDTILKYKNKLANGSHSMISLGAIDLYDSNAVDFQITGFIFNNYDIKIGKFRYWTEISETGSVAKYTVITKDRVYGSGTIPLADISLKNQESMPKIDFCFNDGKIFGENKIKNYTTIKSSEIIRKKNGPSKNIFYFWEQISGPNCLKFSDLNKDAKFGSSNPQLAYTTSTQDTPDIYVGVTGAYEVKCSITTKFGLYSSDTYKFEVRDSVSSSDKLDGADGVVLPLDAGRYDQVMLGTIPQIAFNKYGLIWILKSNNYIDVGQTNSQIQEDYGKIGIIRYNNFQFDTRKNPKVWMRDTEFNERADLSIKLSNNNTKILLYNITIENMRDESYDLCQCKSFYEEKIIRKKDGANDPITGASSFDRDYKSKKQLYYHNVSGLIIPTRYVTTETPEVSTTTSPPILAYGGYDNITTKQIGIKIPKHPGPGCELPYLINKNDFVRNDDITISSGNLFCYLKEVLPSGSGHYAEATPGIFHPTSGWLSFLDPDNTVTRDPEKLSYQNLSFVVKNDVKKHKSFIFNGPGILNIKPSLDGKPFRYQSIINLKVDNIYNTSSRGTSSNGFGFYNVNSNRQLNPNYICDDFPLNSWRNINQKKDFIEKVDTKSINSSYTTYKIPKDYMEKDIEISDIEVKLNFLNYPNLKNLAIWLEVYGGDEKDNDPMVSNSGIFINSYQSRAAYFQPVIDYNNNLSSLMNSGNRIYLLNQEYVSNYNHNNSIAFTESVSKNISFDKINYHQKILWPDRELNVESNSIYPTSVASGYDDIDSSYYSIVLKTNNLNDKANSLKKFNNKFLSKTGTKPLSFALNISVIDPISYDNRILDNLLINNSVISTTEKKIVSNTLNNSLCSWDVIIHTKKVPKPIQKDILGYINYEDVINSGNYFSRDQQIASNGFDFIADFSDKNFLLPQININAPYNSLANINSCFYDDEDSYRGRSIKPLDFPSVLYYLLATSTLGFTTIIGTLTSLINLQMIFGAGGRNDPIMNFLIEDKLLKNKDDSNQQYYKAVYSDLEFGDADRAVISVSQSGTIWYDLEVPIFRYMNTPIVKRNEYKFIKLHENTIKDLSFFPFKKVTSYKDLDLSNCSVIASSGIDSVGGSFSGNKTIDGTNVKDLDIIRLDNQQEETENGYYIIPTGSNTWIKIPSTKSLDFLIYNKIDHSRNINIYKSIKDEKNILINGIRPYDFFDVGETIFIKEPSGYNRISNKNLISTTDGMKTLIELTGTISKDSSMSIKENESKTLFLYKDSYTTISPDTIPINKWAFNKSQSEKLHDIDPESRTSCYGEGSIGWGSDQNSPENLYKINLTNKILDINKTVNNNTSDYHKFNSLYITSGTLFSGSIPTNKLTSRPLNNAEFIFKTYSYNDMGYIFENINSKFDSLDPENDRLIRTLRYSSTKNNEDKIFLEIKSNQFMGPNFPVSGEIYIEDDYKCGLITKFSDIDKDRIKIKLDSLVEKGITISGDGRNHAYFADSLQDNIPGLIEYYNNLASDPTGCYTTGTYNPNICIKNEVKQKLSNLFYKKQKLDEALHINSSIIGLPHISGFLSVDGSVSYKENKDLYWFHIDEDQPCIVNNEISVKILVKIIYEVLPVVDRTIRPNTFITPELTQQILIGGNAVSCKNQPLQLTYTVSQSRINSEKDILNELFPSLNWAYSDNSEGKAGIGDQLFKYGGHYTSLSNDAFSSPYISSKKFIVCPSSDSGKDVLVFATEYYIRPENLFPAPKDTLKAKKIKEVFTSLPNQKLKIKFKNIPRKLRDVDPSQYKKYSFDYMGNLVPNGKSSSTLNIVENNFQCWECVNSSGNLVKELPPYFIASNEMRYRAFFGSVDGIENKNTDLTDSKQDWEWIPYEFYKNDCSLSVDSRRIAHGGLQSIGANSNVVFRIKDKKIYIATETETTDDYYGSYRTKILGESEIKELDKIKNFPWLRKLQINTTIPDFFGIPYENIDVYPCERAPKGRPEYKLCEIVCVSGLNGDGTVSDADISNLRTDYFLEKSYDKINNKLVRTTKVTKYITVECTTDVLGKRHYWKTDDPTQGTYGHDLVLDPDTLEWNVNLEDMVTRSVSESPLHKTSKANRMIVTFSYPYVSHTIPALPGNTIGLKFKNRGDDDDHPCQLPDSLRSIRIITESKSCMGIKKLCENTTIFHKVFSAPSNFESSEQFSIRDGKNVKLLYHDTGLQSEILTPYGQTLIDCMPCVINLSNVTLCAEMEDIRLGTCIDPNTGTERELD
jgi:hypothetical protein